MTGTTSTTRATAAPEDIAKDPAERRVTRRLRNYWDAIKDDGGLPTREAFAIEAIPEFRRYGFLLDLSDLPNPPVFRFLGSELARIAGTDLLRQPVTRAASHKVLGWIAKAYPEVASRGQPILFEPEAEQLRGFEYLFRATMIPFAENRRDVDFIAGIMTFRAQSSETTGTAEGDSGARAVAVDAGADGLMRSLKECQAVAQLVAVAEAKSRKALYMALARAYAFYFEANRDPAGYRRLCTEAGIEVSPRAPMTALIKLIFGRETEKTRVSEYATCLTHALRMKRTPEDFVEFVESIDGGIKGCVKAERTARRRAHRRQDAAKRAARETAVAESLRSLASLVEVPDETAGSEEFVLLLGRRTGTDSHRVQVLCVLEEGPATVQPVLQRAARRIAKRAGKREGDARSLQKLLQKSA
ncbi:MAG TPA: PAS domain-containing protein [Kiloniellales bacterium]|nr:PAS domain-containing protein [Kiloniellales bacterium]